MGTLNQPAHAGWATSNAAYNNPVASQDQSAFTNTPGGDSHHTPAEVVGTSAIDAVFTEDYPNEVPYDFLARNNFTYAFVPTTNQTGWGYGKAEGWTNNGTYKYQTINEYGNRVGGPYDGTNWLGVTQSVGGNPFKRVTFNFAVNSHARAQLAANNTGSATIRSETSQTTLAITLPAM